MSSICSYFRSHFPGLIADIMNFQVVESVLVINPGYLSKRRAAGSYTKLTVYPMELTDEEKASTQMIGHRVFARTRVDIMRI